MKVRKGTIRLIRWEELIPRYCSIVIIYRDCFSSRKNIYNLKPATLAPSAILFG